MKRFILLILFLTVLLQGVVLSQQYSGTDSTHTEYYNKIDFGIGFGMDYGGIIGLNTTYSPSKYLGLFAGAGVHFGGLAMQIGAKGYIIPKISANKVRPYVKAMYGINAATFVSGTDRYSTNFYGPTFGFGCEFRFGKYRNNGLNLDLNLPIRSQEFTDAIEKMKNDDLVDVVRVPYNFTISLGYHWEY